MDIGCDLFLADEREKLYEGIAAEKINEKIFNGEMAGFGDGEL